MHKERTCMQGQGTLSTGDPVDLTSLTLADNVNVHGLRLTVSAKAQVSGDLHDIQIALLCIPADITTEVNIDPAVLDNAPLSDQIWLIDRLMVSSSEVISREYTPATTRSCHKGDKIAFKIRYNNNLVGTGNTSYVWWCSWWPTQL